MAPQCWQEGFGLTTIRQALAESSEDHNDDDHRETHRSDNPKDP